MTTDALNESYPEHDRTSCDDLNPANATAEGSTGCARCTAIAIERGRRAEQLLVTATQALEKIAASSNEADIRKLASGTVMTLWGFSRG